MSLDIVLAKLCAEDVKKRWQGVIDGADFDDINPPEEVEKHSAFKVWRGLHIGFEHNEVDKNTLIMYLEDFNGTVNLELVESALKSNSRLGKIYHNSVLGSDCSICREVRDGHERVSINIPLTKKDNSLGYSKKEVGIYEAVRQNYLSPMITALFKVI